MSGGRRQAVGATRRRNRHIAHKRYRNALQGRTAQRGAHCRIQDSGDGRVCGVLPTGAGVDRGSLSLHFLEIGATHGRRGRQFCKNGSLEPNLQNSPVSPRRLVCLGRRSRENRRTVRNRSHSEMFQTPRRPHRGAGEAVGPRARVRGVSRICESLRFHGGSPRARGRPEVRVTTCHPLG